MENHLTIRSNMMPCLPLLTKSTKAKKMKPQMNIDSFWLRPGCSVFICVHLWFRSCFCVLVSIDRRDGRTARVRVANCAQLLSNFFQHGIRLSARLYDAAALPAPQI